MRFVERLQTYRIQDSTQFGWIETNETATLSFDLYRCDDDERCRDDMEYLLDVSVPRERLMIIEGAGERLHGSFSAAILTADLYGDALRLLTA